MNAREFFDTVCQMRTAQRVYYAHRKDPDRKKVSEYLQKALDLEGIIDKEITRVVEIIAKQQNQIQQ